MAIEGPSLLDAGIVDEHNVVAVAARRCTHPGRRQHYTWEASGGRCRWIPQHDPPGGWVGRWPSDLF
jgi:hypothetical protein